MDAIGNKSDKEKQKMRKKIIPFLIKLEKKFGIVETRYTMRWFLRTEAEKESAQKEIEKQEEKLRLLKAGKPIPYGY